MALRPRQTALYTDAFTSYRGTAAIIASNGPKAVTRIINAKPCKLFTTPNFDQTVGNYTQHKEANIMTANKLHCDVALDIQDGDIVHITSGPTGVTTWWRVNGEPESRAGIANRSQVYLVPTPFNPANIH